jgi:hypothetical protein
MLVLKIPHLSVKVAWFESVMKMASSVHHQPAFTKHDDSYAFNENVFYKLLRGLKRIFQCGLILILFV